MVWSRDRCCVAIPLYNVGIYAILGQFAIISLVTGVLSFAAGHIVAVSIPGTGSYILGALCCIVFALQGWGFFGVYKEKPATYRRYVRVNTIAVVLTFVMAMVWIVISAVRHNTATSNCMIQFIADSNDSNSTLSNSVINIDPSTVSGHTLCSVFTWVQLGIMGGLWLALLVVEFYFAMMSRIYGSEQREDHRRYNSIYTEQRQSIIRQSMMYDRTSVDGDSSSPPQLVHGRTFSNVSRSSALRNEVKMAGQDGMDDPSASTEAFHDSPLYASPIKGGGYPNNAARPASGYSNSAQSAQYANSRSNLAPEDSSPAYMNQHSGYQSHTPTQGLRQNQNPAYSADNRYRDGEEDFIGYDG